MTPKVEQTITAEEYKTRLDQQKETALQNANELIRRQLDYMKTLAGDHAINPTGVLTGGNVLIYNDPLMQAMEKKANELTREFGKLADEEARPFLLARQEVIFSNWQRRLEMILSLNGKDNKDPNIDEIRNQGAALIQGLNIPQFMAQNLRGPLKDAYLRQIEAQGQQLVPDFTDTLTRLNRGEIKPEDWDILIANLDALGTSKDWVETSAAMGLVGALPPRFRPELLRKLVDKPDYEQIVLRLLTGNYLTTAQVEVVLKEQIAAASAQGKPTANLEIILAKAKSELTSIQQEEVENAQEQGVERIAHNRQIGHTNSVRNTLTYEGVIGSLLAINGIATVAANVLMDITPENWSNIPENPAIWMGLGMLGGGLELNDGFGGMMDKPSTKFGKLFESKDEIKARELLMNQNAFEREVMRYPNTQELYFQFAEEINAAYSKKTAETHDTQVTLTMEEMNINWDTLPKEFQSMKKTDVEAFMSKWVSRLAGPGTYGNQSIDSQKKFIGGDVNNVAGKTSDCRVKYGLTPLEGWKPEDKRKYLLRN